MNKIINKKFVNKKNVGLLLFVVFSFVFSFSFVSAQETIRDVELGFCNDGTGSLSTKSTLMVNPGSKKDLCIQINNNGKKPAQIVYSFPKGSFSPGGNQICDTSNSFAKFFLDNPNRSVIVSGGTSMIINETILAPIGMSGMYYGCLAYNLGEPEVESMGGMFKLVVRKALNINLFIGGDSFVNNAVEFLDVTGTVFSTNKHVGVFYNDDGDLVLNLNLRNNGNTTQNISLEGKIYNALGFEKSFSVETKKMMPGESLPVSSIIGILPFYKGLYSVRMSLKGVPVFEFDVSGLSEKVKAPITVKETSTVFIFSWVYVITILLVLAIIVKVLLPRRKKKAEAIAA